MPILLVGATGVLGSAVASALTDAGDDVVGVTRTSDPKVDLTDLVSIQALFDSIGTVDAICCAAGGTPFGSVADLTIAQYQAGIASKLLGQLALVAYGLGNVSDGGSVTLISGILSEDPIAAGSVSAIANGGLQAYVKSAALSMPRGIRINTVSPTVLTESVPSIGSSFPGYPPVTAAEAARAYVKSVHGAQTGQVYRVGYTI